MLEVIFKPEVSYMNDDTLRQFWSLGAKSEITDELFRSSIHPDALSLQRTSPTTRLLLQNENSHLPWLISSATFNVPLIRSGMLRWTIKLPVCGGCSPRQSVA
jgi:hypothetical protein